MKQIDVSALESVYDLQIYDLQIYELLISIEDFSMCDLYSSV
jgi:hypothetical protein